MGGSGEALVNCIHLLIQEFPGQEAGSEQVRGAEEEVGARVGGPGIA